MRSIQSQIIAVVFLAACFLTLSIFTGLTNVNAAANEPPVITEQADHSIQFDGISGAAVARNVPFANSFSAELWAKSDTDVWNEDGFLMSARGSNGFILHPIKGTKDVYLQVSTINGFNLGPIHVEDITQWHHYAVVVHSPSLTYIYLDGNLVASSASGNQRGITRNVDLWIGNDLGSRFGHVEVDEVRVWNYARSSADIAKHMDHKLKGNETGLVHYWNFDPIQPGTASGGYSVGTRSVQDSFDVYENQVATSLPRLEFTVTNAVYDEYTLDLHVARGQLHLNSTTNLSLISGGDNTSGMVWSGTRDDLNSALQSATYQPNTGEYGSDLLTVHVTDIGNADGATPAVGSYTLPITINQIYINVHPTFTKGADTTVKEGSERQTISDWVTQISAGAGENQNVRFHVSNNQPGLFLEQPAIDEFGTLTYQPNSDVTGIVTISVSLQDDGGTLFNGVNTSVTATARITVEKFNTLPMIRNNHAVRFNGIDNQILVPAVPLGRAFTVEVWARSNTPVWDEDGFLLSSRGANGIIFHPNKGTNTMSLFVMSGTAGTEEFILTNVFQPDDITEWHHYALTYSYEYIETAGTWSYVYVSYKVYLDGTLIHQNLSQENEVMRVRATNGSMNLLIGRDDYTGDRFGNADIDDVRVWSRVLSSTEIAENYSRNLIGNETGLQLYMDMETIEEGVVPDLSAAGGIQNGTLSGDLERTFAHYVLSEQPTVQQVDEDTSKAFLLNEVYDADAGDAILMAELTSVHGMLHLPLLDTNGLTVIAGENDSSYLTLSGSMEDLNAELRNLSYQSDPDFNGTDSVTLKVTDAGNGRSDDVKSATRIYPVQVQSVNDAPSFTKGADQQVEPNAVAQAVAEWATDVSVGASDEASQLLVFTVSNDRADLFAVQPSIGSHGTLQYTPAANVTGEAIVTVSLQDNGGTADGGVDTSASQTFKIAIQVPVPVLTVGSLVIAEAVANDGSITATQVVTLTHGTFAADMTGGVSVDNLPAGLGFSITRDNDTQITISFTGKASSHTNDDDVSNIAVMVDQAQIVSATEAVLSNTFGFDFADPTTSPELPPTTDPTTSPESPSSKPTMPPDGNLETPTSGSTEVLANERSELNIKDSVNVVVPKGAVGSDGTLNVTRVPTNEMNNFGNLQSLSPWFEFTSTSGHHLAVPLELTFHYDVNGIAKGYKPAVYYYNELRNRWIYIGGTVNTNGTITIKVNHFTKFAVFETLQTSISDLEGHWAAPYTDRLIGMKVIQGYTDGLFHPGDTVTRGQFARMMTEALGLVGNDTNMSFADEEDIPSWARSAAMAMEKAGLMNGYEENGKQLFKANQNINRVEMSAILAGVLKTYGIRTEDMTVPFKDGSSIPDWAKSSVEAAVSANIMNGDKEGTFRPNDTASRAEAATTIYKMLEALHM